MGGNIKNYEGVTLCGDLSEDLETIKKIFLRDAILRVRRFHAGGSLDLDCAAVYFDGMVNVSVLNDSIIRPLIDLGLFDLTADSDAEPTRVILDRVLYSNEIAMTGDLSEMLRGIMYGDTLLLVNGSVEALVINTKGWERRSVSEPKDERILEGPREGFCESAMTNLSLIRRKLQTPDLCIELLRVGRRTDTKIFLCYLGSLTPRRLIKEVRRRIERLDVDGIFDSNYIAELTSARRYSLFRSSGSTERPDIVAARLLEGRAALIVDGTPMALTFPYLFAENFQSDEDYYQNFLTASVGRALRYLSFFISVCLPAIYIALTVFHRRLLPTAFLISLSSASEGVPFSSVTECVVLIIIFEILKEAGVRTEQSLGTALSIVGGLVVGQAAVEAKLVSAPMLIIVALSGIGGLMIPRLRAAVFYLRLSFVLLASLLGLYGFFLGVAFLSVAILSMRSYGFDATPLTDSRDGIFRAPLWKMKLRPPITENRVRMDLSEKEDMPYENISIDN